MNWNNQHRSTHYIHHDPAAVQAQQRQAAATEYQNRLIANQNEILQAQLELERQRLEHERQKTRAADLGITHAEYVRRMIDNAEALRNLEEIKSQYSYLYEAIEVQRRLARRHARRLIWGLQWRNRCNWLRHPFKTRAAMRPYAQRLAQDAIVNHSGLMGANRHYQAMTPQISAAEGLVARTGLLL